MCTESGGTKAWGGPGSPRIVVLVASSALGAGDDEIGRVLMGAFLKNLARLDVLPWRAIFLNTGVRLTTEGSKVIDDLRVLADRGTEILSCGTCLEWFDLKDRLLAGRVSNMREIVESLLAADRVVRP